MSKLIDADALIEELGKHYIGSFRLDTLAQQYIDAQPIAYDVDAVVAELDKLMVKTTSKMVESKDVPEWFYEVKTGEYINKKDAIDIVRKGGVE